MVWAELIGLAVSAYGAHEQDKAKKASLNQYKKAEGAQTEANQLNQAYRALALRQQQLGLGDVRKGYDQALSSVGALGAEGYRQIADQGKMAGSLATQNAYGRGLYNTTAGQSMQQQAAYQTQRAQGSLSERLAGLRANLYAGRGAAMAGARSGIAGTLQQNALGGAQDTNALVNLYGSRSDTFDPAIYGQIGQSAALLSSYFKKNTYTPPETNYVKGYGF